MQSLHRVEKSPPSDGTGGIMAGDLSTQSIIGAVPVCLPYRHVPPLEMTMLARALRHFDESEVEWRNLLSPMVHEAWRQEISGLRVTIEPCIPARYPLEVTMGSP